MPDTPKNISSEVILKDLKSFLKAKRGRASELAKHLGVPLPQLSNWMSGRFSPNPETLTSMQSWKANATAQEAAESAEVKARLRSAINSLRGR